MQPVEMIAAKVYFPGGIVLHTVFFGGSIYCVLADSVEDLPLLDVAFPDVTAKCRGCVGVECLCVLECRDHRAGVLFTVCKSRRTTPQSTQPLG